MVFIGGGTTQTVSIPPCPECAEADQETVCDDELLGFIEEFELEPGDYTVSVTVSGAGRVTPFRGAWDLEGIVPIPELLLHRIASITVLVSIWAGTC